MHGERTAGLVQSHAHACLDAPPARRTLSTTMLCVQLLVMSPRRPQAAGLPAEAGAIAQALRLVVAGGHAGVRTAMWIDAVLHAVDRVKEMTRRHGLCRRAMR